MEWQLALLSLQVLRSLLGCWAVSPLGGGGCLELCRPQPCRRTAAPGGWIELDSVAGLPQQPSFMLFKKANYLWLNSKKEDWRLQKQNQLPELNHHVTKSQGEIWLYRAGPTLSCSSIHEFWFKQFKRRRLSSNNWVSFTRCMKTVSQLICSKTI